MSELAPIQILLVEDEAILAMEMSETLEMEGYVVVGTAASGRRALEIFQEHSVDLLICDIHRAGQANLPGGLHSEALQPHQFANFHRDGPQ
jgi:CheY-like chemotaxis protein